jgi:HNH endonuclease
MGKRNDPVAHLYSNYIPEPNSGCWLWLGPYTNGGYGVLHLGKRLHRVYAHRKMLSLTRPTSDESLHACHHCDVPSCINPNHLFWGTMADNMQDAKRKGRTSSPPLSVPGMKSYKLSASQAKEIRASTESTKIVAARYGICTQTVRRIRGGLSWRHLP